MARKDTTFGYVFPAIRGVQAKREYYVSMCPLRLIPKIFLFDEEELVPELRAQRGLNKARVPEIARYMTGNRDNYVFSALTASIDADVRFDPLGDDPNSSRVGLLHVPMDARFIINDGQHRRAAIEIALREQSELADETIAVVFFLDVGLERSQQMFADLNRYAIRPSKSLGVLYDHRDYRTHLAKLIVLQSPCFRGIVEMERSTLSLRSRKLFTLSAIYHATISLLDQIDSRGLDEDAKLAIAYWEEVAKQMPEWESVREGKMPASEVRQERIHSHGIVLQAMGTVGNMLLRGEPGNWKNRLKALRKIDWSRSNGAMWEGRAMIGGRVSKAGHNVTLTTNAIKHHLKIPLGPEEQRVEDVFQRSRNGRARRGQAR